MAPVLEGRSRKRRPAEKENLKRLAAVLSIVAVRMLALRDLADQERCGKKAQDPVVLKARRLPRAIDR